MKILVASCDKNSDLFEPFYHCMEKYWPDHPEVIYSTETVLNPHYKTICKNYPINRWTRRVRETLQEIDDDQILVMCDDVFIRSLVDGSKINKFSDILKNDDIASINFEKSFDRKDTDYNELLKQRSDNGNYKVSVMCNLYDKNKLIKLLTGDHNPWEFEVNNNHLGFKYLVCKDYAINWGYKGVGDWFGVRRGQWCREVVNFFSDEGISVDYNQRGFYD